MDKIFRKRLTTLIVIILVWSSFTYNLIISFENGTIMFSLFGTGMLLVGSSGPPLKYSFLNSFDYIIIALYSYILIVQLVSIKKNKESINTYKIISTITSLIIFWHIFFKFYFIKVMSSIDGIQVVIIQGPGSILLLISLIGELIICILSIKELKKENMKIIQ
jgi:hypothetical protein